MNSFDILEELGNLDDDLLLRAQEDPPKRHYIWFRGFRGAAAACLSLVLLVTAWLAVDVTAGGETLRWTVRYRESGVTYLFKGGTEHQEQIGSYMPTWIPEGYQLKQDSRMEDEQTASGSGDLIYYNPDDPQDCIWFRYSRIPYRAIFRFSSLVEDSYTKKTVDINGIAGDLYQYQSEPAGGVLIWIDTENCMVFQVDYFDDDPTVAQRVAQSVVFVESTEEAT